MAPTVPRQQNRSAASGCPSWCVVDHAHQTDDLVVHLGQPVLLCEGVDGHLRLAVDRRTGNVDGPHVVVGSATYGPAEAGVLAQLLLDLATEAAGPATAQAAAAAAQDSWTRGERLLVAAPEL